jgi:HEAT repeat protein
LEVLELEAQQLAKRFEGTALLRPGVAGLRRNAAISLAKRDDARSLQVLIERLLQDPSAVVRAACAWSLGQRSEPEAKEALRAAAATEPEGAVFQAIVRALGEGHASGSHFR